MTNSDTTLSHGPQDVPQEVESCCWRGSKKRGWKSANMARFLGWTGAFRCLRKDDQGVSIVMGVPNSWMVFVREIMDDLRVPPF